MNATYTIQLPQFKGPFDLLLFFIERDELDIYDIPIAKITDDFLGYIRKMEALNMDLASEFILVAATLMRIKAKMLIPRKPLDDEGNEIDPREELVLRLIEYKRYKSVLDEMRQKEADRWSRNQKGSNPEDLSIIAEKVLVDLELESLTLFKLMKAFQGVIDRVEDKKKKAIHKVYTYNYSVQGQQIFILSKVRPGQKASFDLLFKNCQDRMHAIITFLGLLELLNLQKVKCTTGEGINDFYVEINDLNENAMSSEEE